MQSKHRAMTGLENPTTRYSCTVDRRALIMFFTQVALPIPLVEANDIASGVIFLQYFASGAVGGGRLDTGRLVSLVGRKSAEHSCSPM